MKTENNTGNFHKDFADIEDVNIRRQNSLPRSVPKRITLQVTNICNSRCSICNIWTIYHKNKQKLRSELLEDEFLLIIDKAVTCGIKSIDVTGGEPFLKYGIVQILTLILNRLGFTCVTTNGLLPEMIANQVEQVLTQTHFNSTFVVSVSLDGFPETYAKIRGVKDGFYKAIKLMKMLHKLSEKYRQLIYQVSFTISDDNYHELIPLLDFLLQENLIQYADQFTFRPAQTSDYYRCTNQIMKTKEIIKEINNLQNKYSFTRDFHFIEGIKASLLNPNTLILPCYALFVSCWINPYGDVAPCVTMTDNIIGNLHHTDYDIMPIWESEQAAQVRKMIKMAQCPICWTDCQADENLYYGVV